MTWGGYRPGSKTTKQEKPFFSLTLETKPLVSDEMRRFQQEIGVRLSKEQADTLAFAIITPVIHFTDIRSLTSLPYPRIKEIAAYLVHQMLLQETGDGGFVLADTIRRRYEHAMEQRDHVGTKSGPSWHQVGTKSALSRHQVQILATCKIEQAVPDLLNLVGRTDRTKFRTDLLNPLLEEGLVEMTIPDKPKSSKWPLFLNQELNRPGQEKIMDSQLNYPRSNILPFGHDDIRIYMDNLFMEGYLKPVACGNGPLV